MLEDAEAWYRERSGEPARGPIGLFHSRDNGLHRINKEIDATGDAWPPLRAELFDGDWGKLEAVRAKLIGLLNDTLRFG